MVYDHTYDLPGVFEESDLENSYDPISNIKLSPAAKEAIVRIDKYLEAYSNFKVNKVTVPQALQNITNETIDFIEYYNFIIHQSNISRSNAKLSIQGEFLKALIKFLNFLKSPEAPSAFDKDKISKLSDLSGALANFEQRDVDKLIPELGELFNQAVAVKNSVITTKGSLLQQGTNA